MASINIFEKCLYVEYLLVDRFTCSLEGIYELVEFNLYTEDSVVVLAFGGDTDP